MNGGSSGRKLRGRTWVTRKGIHVDRMASAWLIRRFIDEKARFKFVPGKSYEPQAHELRFDMFEAEYTHEGDHCTFEVLIERFGMDDPGLRSLAEIVHDIDLKDGKFGRPETAGVDRLLHGLVDAHPDSATRITAALPLFDALHASFGGRPPKPAPRRRRRK